MFNNRSNFATFATNSLRSLVILHLLTKIGQFYAALIRRICEQICYITEGSIWHSLKLRNVCRVFESVGYNFGTYNNYSPPPYEDRSIFTNRFLNFSECCDNGHSPSIFRKIGNVGEACVSVGNIRNFRHWQALVSIRNILVRRGPTEYDRGLRPRWKYSLYNRHFGRNQREIKIFIFTRTFATLWEGRHECCEDGNSPSIFISIGQPFVPLVKRAYCA